MFLFGQCPKNVSGKVFTWEPTTSQLRFNSADSANPLKLAPFDGNVLEIRRNGPAKKSGEQRSSWRTKHRKKSTMPNDSHQRAAEFHELAAHAHRAAAAHHAKEDTRQGTSIQSRRWNMQIRRWSRLRNLIGDRRKLWGTHEPE